MAVDHAEALEKAQPQALRAWVQSECESVGDIHNACDMASMSVDSKQYHTARICASASSRDDELLVVVVNAFCVESLVCSVCVGVCVLWSVSLFSRWASTRQRSSSQSAMRTPERKRKWEAALILNPLPIFYNLLLIPNLLLIYNLLLIPSLDLLLSLDLVILNLLLLP